MAEEFKMTKELWDLANLITGFAIAQNLATTFAMAKGDWRVSLKGTALHWGAAAATIVFTAFYIWAIVWSCNQQPPAGSDTWEAVKWGRVGAVILFTLVTLGTLYGHRRDETGRGLRKEQLVEPQSPLMPPS